jgi:hypothetical protein
LSSLVSSDAISAVACTRSRFKRLAIGLPSVSVTERRLYDGA